MPMYSCRCKGCRKEFEKYSTVDRYKFIRCDCGSDVDILIKNVSVHIFQPAWYEHITDRPIWIESKKQLKQECDKHGKIAVGLE